MSLVNFKNITVSLDGVESAPPGAINCGVAYKGDPVSDFQSLIGRDDIQLSIVGDDASYDSACDSAASSSIKYVHEGVNYLISGSFIRSFRVGDSYNVIFSVSSITQQ